MISELVTIEHYFGRLEAVMTLEDLVRTYGADRIKEALEQDELEIRAAFCSLYARLTDKARRRHPLTSAGDDVAPVPAA